MADAQSIGRPSKRWRNLAIATVLLYGCIAGGCTSDALEPTADTGATSSSAPAQGNAADFPENECDALTAEELTEAVGTEVGPPTAYGGLCGWTVQSDPETIISITSQPWAQIKGDAEAGRLTLVPVAGQEERFEADMPSLAGEVELLHIADRAVSVTALVNGRGDNRDPEIEEKVYEALSTKYLN